jgi:hypothetical protein
MDGWRKAWLIWRFRGSGDGRRLFECALVHTSTFRLPVKEVASRVLCETAGVDLAFSTPRCHLGVRANGNPDGMGGGGGVMDGGAGRNVGGDGGRIREAICELGVVNGSSMMPRLLLNVEESVCLM